MSRPELRKVTAQRKFAQGAFVPPHATNGALERREIPSTSHDESILRYSNMPMESVLDYLCFRNNHAHYLPIVLVERLPEPQPVQINGDRPNSKPRAVDSIPTQPRRRKVTKAPVHVMQLRSHNSRVTKRTNVLARKRNTDGDKYNQKKTQQKQKERNTYRFSVDDNRPLKYLASSTRTRPSQSKPQDANKELSSTAANGASAINRTKRKRSKSPPGDVCESMGKTSKAVNTEPSQPVAAPVLLRAESTPRKSIHNAASPLNHYSEQDIIRWIDDNSPRDPELPSQTYSTDIDTIVINDDEDYTIKEESCPASAWQTVNDVLHLSAGQYMLRCMVCVNCKRIETYTRVCDLLKSKCNIDDNFDMTEVVDLSLMCSTDLDTVEFPTHGSGEVIYMEMLPKHPHVMIKCEIKNVDGKTSLYTHLIPRSRAEITVDFSFIKYEFILKKWVQALILNVEDSTNSAVMVVNDITFKEDPESVAGPSGLRNKSPSGVTSQIDEGFENDGKILNAPTYYPTREEFCDPMVYFEKIYKQASEFGICKIVLPNYFAPPCKIDDNIKFEVFNQYISRLYSRWGPATRELCAIRSCLKDNNVGANRAVIDGVEVNLPRLYHLVQNHGGLENVMNKNKWAKVAEDMNLNKGPSTAKKLDQIYVTHLLPYNALTELERQALSLRVEKEWHKRNEKMLQRANNPLHHQKLLLGESDVSSDESDDDATKDVEDCVSLGQSMNLGKFKRVAKNAQYQFFKDKVVPTSKIELEYWKMVIFGTEHICVNSASIDTGEQGIGFTTNKNDGYSMHKWNLKMLSQNKSNILRSLGPVLGVTVPTLHLGMIFSSSCWHRDPHSVPWIEFQHTGPPKIWYSVPEKEGTKFRNASKTLFPTSCQNKDLWLSSDISMIPPNLLAQQKVRVYRVEQNPGEFVLVMPRAYSCSICTGYTVSESVYFATENLLDGLVNAFKEIRKSCEPTMFALEQLLRDIAEDRTSPLSLLEKVYPALKEIIDTEVENRTHLINRGVTYTQDIESTASRGKRSKSTASKQKVWNVRDLDECEICRCTLYMSKVKNIRGNMFLCPEHALKVMVNRRSSVKASELQVYYIYPTEELNSVVSNLTLRMKELAT